MKKNNKVLFGLLIVVLLAVIGLSAYAYQKQKVLNNVKPKVTETKKVESKFEKTIKDKLTNDYNNLVKEMREKIQSNLKDKIASLTINNEDKSNTEKIASVKKELTELQTLVEKEKETIFEKDEEFNEISNLIKTNLSTTEVSQTPTTSNSNNSTNEQVQHTEVVEVPSTQRSRGTTTYIPPRVQNNPTTPSGNSNSGSTVTPTEPVTPTPPESTTSTVSETSGTS